MLAIFHLFYGVILGTNELAELFLGIAIAALSLNLVITTKTNSGTREIAANIGTVSMILTLGMITACLVYYYSRPELLGKRLNSYATRVYPAAGMYRQAEMLFEYMNHHPQFLTPETRLRHGMLLLQMGKESEAKTILALALDEQKRLAEQRPESPGPFFLAGQVLTLLGDRQEAQAAFVKAIKKDRARLERAKDAATEALIRWSLARTLLASGDSSAARDQVSRARALAPERGLRRDIEWWIEANYREERQ